MKTYNLPFQKVSYPISYSQYEYLMSFKNFTSDVVSSNQFMKRMDNDLFEEILEDLKKNIEVVLKD